MTKTRFAAAVASLLVLAAMPSASASSRTPALTLRGSVTLTGSESYVRDVILPRAVTFQDETWHETWRVTAPRGRFAGYVLRQAGTDSNRVTFALATGYCLTRACTRPPWASAYANGCICGGESTTPGVKVLPAGRYRLHLVADGAPVTVNLTFPGLTGTLSIRGGSPHRTTLDTPKPAVLEPPIGPPSGMGANRYSAGATHTARHGGIFYLIAWKVFGVSPPKSVNQSGGCMFDGSPVPGPLGLYQYPCDAGSAGALTPGGQVETGSKTGPMGLLPQYATFTEWFGVPTEGAEAVIHKGTTSLGAYINSHSPATEVHTQIFWLDFKA